MSPQLLDVDDAHLHAGEEGVEDQQREIREVLVVDRVELVLGDQPKQVRHLDRDDPLWLQEDLQALDEVEQPRYVREHVVARDEVGLDTARAEPLRCFGAEEGHLRGNPLVDGRLRDVGGRLDAQDRHAVGLEVLQEVAVVARDLDDL